MSEKEIREKAVKEFALFLAKRSNNYIYEELAKEFLAAFVERQKEEEGREKKKSRRFTEWSDGFGCYLVDSFYAGFYDSYESCVGGEAIDRLAELENKIENGTLIELPCKVGDTVYYETFINGKSVGIKPHKVIGFVLEVMTQDINGFGCTAVPIKDFNKDVFLTKEEAEAKLKEL